MSCSGRREHKQETIVSREYLFCYPFKSLAYENTQKHGFSWFKVPVSGYMMVSYIFHDVYFLYQLFVCQINLQIVVWIKFMKLGVGYNCYTREIFPLLRTDNLSKKISETQSCLFDEKTSISTCSCSSHRLTSRNISNILLVRGNSE